MAETGWMWQKCQECREGKGVQTEEEGNKEPGGEEHTGLDLARAAKGGKFTKMSNNSTETFHANFITKKIQISDTVNRLEGQINLLYCNESTIGAFQYFCFGNHKKDLTRTKPGLKPIK